MNPGSGIGVRTLHLIVMAISLFLLAPGNAWAVLNITVTGSWTETIDKDDLAGGPGSGLTGTYSSAQNVNLITVSGATSNKGDNWQINIKRINTAWNGSLQISARRTSGGSGPGSVSGGEAFIQVSETDGVFFTGAGNLNGIRVQLQLTGVSLQVPPNQYSTTIQYTIIDTP